MADSSGSDESHDEEEMDKQLLFVHKLKEHKIVLNKSQVLQVKLEKEAALKILVQQYKDIFNVTLTTKQLAKKLSNMKAEIKKKFDINKTGNKAIIYKSWEKLLMEMLDVHKNPIFKKIPGAVSVGANENIPLAEPSTSAISDLLAPSNAKEITIPAKKIKMSHLPETEEVQKLSTAELQRLVLLEQLKLCRMQQDEIIKRQKQGDGNFMPNSSFSEEKMYYNL